MRADKNIMHRKYSKKINHLIRSSLIILIGIGVMMGQAKGQGVPGFAPKEAKRESAGQSVAGQRVMPLDQKNWNRPQSSFNWVAMAPDIKVPWDSFGRQGWMTDDAYVDPVDPGTSEFPQDTDLFYIVFSVPGMDAPSQFRAAWYFMPDGNTPVKEHSGTDALYLEMNEKAGYLEIFQPEGGWEKGKYLLRLYYESPGQELYDGNVVGTMLFTIID